MPIIIATISIIAISFAVWLLNKFIPYKICPVCAGISLAWLLISAGMMIGLLEASNWELIVAIAMGGTAAGIAFQAEKKFGWHNPMIKLPIIIAGFILAYFAAGNINLWTLTAEAIIIIVLGYLFFISKIGSGINTADPKKPKPLQR